MAALPVLVSDKKSLYSSLPALPNTSVAVSAGDVFKNDGRIIECITAGTIPAGGMSSNMEGNLMATYIDSDTFRTVTFGTAVFRDVIGHPNFGWDYAVPSLWQLYQVNNPNQISSYSTIERPTLGRHTVFFDSNCEFWITRSLEPRDTGIAMWGYWDITNTVYSGDSGYESSVNLGQPAQTEFPAYISVDADSPAYVAKKGATIHFRDAGAGQYIIGGYGYMEGFILDIAAEVSMSGAATTICHMWFENCDWLLSAPVVSAIYGRTDGGVGNPGVFIDVMFSNSYMEFRKDVRYCPTGKLHFENSKIDRASSFPLFDVNTSYSSIDFVGTDFTGLVGDAPLVTVSTFCPRTEIQYEGCSGLKLSHVKPDIPYGKGSYRVEVFGGELDGVWDPERYLLFTENFEASLTTEYYAYSSATADTYGLLTYKYDTYDTLTPGLTFCVLQKLSAWAEVGLYEISVVFLVPEDVEVTPENMWLDVSTVGEFDGQIFSSRGIASNLQEDEDTTWVKPSGFKAYRVTIHAPHDASGVIAGSVYCVIPNCTLYLSGSLHAMKVA